MKKLELGSGNRPRPGYEHLDIDPACPDLHYCCSFDNIPVKKNTFDELLSVHSIEHISWRQTVPTLKEWYRVLKPGGKLRIECPNLRWICQSYLDNNHVWYDDFKTLHPQEQEHLKVNGYHSNTLWANFKLFSSTANGDVHLAGLDAYTLRNQLQEAGFCHVDIIQDDSTLCVEAYK